MPDLPIHERNDPAKFDTCYRTGDGQEMHYHGGGERCQCGSQANVIASENDGLPRPGDSGPLGLMSGF